ncbi:MAG: 50S ribosomal protein L9 [Chloroflexi bacterium]|jgi:large subunit ribosomal protein L9|nr:50S ribosomal protein L9 [Chloroflexota bacterium]
MKVVFLQDVPNVAKAGEIKEVAAGYGRNFLIPRKLAALVSPQAMSQVETSDKAQAKTNEGLAELARQLEGKEVSLKAHAGAKERLYGSITSADIAAELESTTGLVIDKRKIELDEPIRQLGSYEVTIRLGKDIIPKIMVSVVEEEAPPQKEEKPPKKEKKVVKKAPKAEKKPAKKGKKPETETKAKTAKTTKKKEAKTTKTKKTTKKEAAAPKKTKKTTTKAKTTKKKEETA